jgi:hypothetical protein
MEINFLEVGMFGPYRIINSFLTNEIERFGERNFCQLCGTFFPVKNGV